MERNIPMLIQYLASVFSLRRGDAIFTGTPAGVGPIRSGDLVVGELGTIARVELHVG
jgi:5-carboxymethyl-2-hydroxymuconate isomerase